MSAAVEIEAGTVPELTDSKSHSTTSIDKNSEEEKVVVVDVEEDQENVAVIEKAEDVAIQVRSTFSFFLFFEIVLTALDPLNARRPKLALRHLPLSFSRCWFERFCIGKHVSA